MRVVNSLDELLILPRDKWVNGLHTRVPVRLEIPALTRPALSSAQDALNSLQERRGALTGAVSMFITLLYGVTQVFRHNASLLSLHAWSEFGVVLAVAFGMGFAGRFSALVFTRWQFAHRCRVQYRMLSMLLQPSA